MTTLLDALFLIVLVLGILAAFVFLFSAAFTAWAAYRQERL